MLPSGEARFLDRIELKIVFDREHSDERFDRKVYGAAGVSFASKTYTRGGEKAHFTFSLLQYGAEASAGAVVRTPDGKSRFAVTNKMKSRVLPAAGRQSH